MVYLFPGQGSQEVGMGSELFDRYSKLTNCADEILGYSLKDLCFKDESNLLGQTNYTQPALFVVSALSYLAHMEDGGEKPSFLAGHSLGEYNALFAAGVFDFETGVKLTAKRGELMSKVSGGGMAAVIGLQEHEVRNIIANKKLDGIYIANLNTPTQIVLSGMKQDIVAAQSIFEQAGAIKYAILNVSGAFHSVYMQPAMEEFAEYLENFDLSAPKIPVISNMTARVYSPYRMKENMNGQIVSSVRWTETVRALLGAGETELIQIGPGCVITGLVRQIMRSAEPLKVDLFEHVNADKRKEQSVGVASPVVHEKSSNVSIVQTADETYTAENMGSKSFRERYRLKYAYVTGAMYKGVASKELVADVCNSGMLGFLGTGGVNSEKVEQDIVWLRSNVKGEHCFGANFIHTPSNSKLETELCDIYIRNGVKVIEASAFISITRALVKYRLNSIYRDAEGNVLSDNHIIAKLSRPEVAAAFLSPAPKEIVEKLLNDGEISPEAAKMASCLPMADDICVEADSGGHTDHGVAFVLLPTIRRLRDEYTAKYGYKQEIHVGYAGGIGTPEAAAAAFIMKADFIVTGSINQATVEAATSDKVKDMLQNMNIQDTAYAPAGDMFEYGSKVQVLKKGVFFPSRASILYDLYRSNDSIETISPDMIRHLEQRYFKRTIAEVYNEVKKYNSAEIIKEAEINPKVKMACIFKWYFGYATRMALSGDPTAVIDYQIHCGPAMGAFNQWVKNTSLSDWRNRHASKLGLMIMEGAAKIFAQI